MLSIKTPRQCRQAESLYAAKVGLRIRKKNAKENSEAKDKRWEDESLV